MNKLIKAVMMISLIFSAIYSAAQNISVPVVHETVDVNGVKTHYLKGGKGKVVLLLHGWPETSYTWRKVMPILIEKGYTVIAPDLPGLGDSDIPKTGFTKKALAQDIHRFMNKLGYNNIYLVGHDWGGPIAYAYATQYPGEVKKLVILEVGPPDANLEKIPLLNRNGPNLWWFNFHMVQTLPETLISGKEKEYLQWFYTNSSYKGMLSDPADLNEYYRTYSDPAKMHAGLEYYRSIYKDIDDNKIFAQHKLTMPVLALGGQFGLGMTAYMSMKFYATNVSGGIIKDSGHFIAEEKPKELADKLAAFFIKK